MKNAKANNLIKCGVLSGVIAGIVALLVNDAAAQIIKANNTDSLELGSAWVNGVAPGANDQARWNNTVSAANADFTFADDWRVKEFYFIGTSADFTITGTSGGKTLLLNSGWTLDASQTGKNVTINANVKLMTTGEATFTIGAGGTLAVNGNVSRDTGVTGAFAKNGLGTVNLTGLMTDMNGFNVANGVLNVSGTVLTSWNGALGVSGGLTATTTTATLRLVDDGRFETIQNLNLGGNNSTLSVSVNDRAKLVTTSLTVGRDNLAGQTVKFGQNDGLVSLAKGTTDNRLLSILSNATSSTAEYNLNGGVLEMDQAKVGNGGTLRLNGGTIKLIQGGWELFKDGAAVGGKVLIGENGAIVDTNGKTTGANAGTELPLEHDLALGAEKDGGLRVQGGGTLILSKVNTFTGETVVEANTTLQIDATGKLSLGDVTVNGTLILKNNTALDTGATLTLGAAGLVNLNYNGSLTVESLLVNGSLLDAGTYGSAKFTELGISNYFTGNGSLIVSIPEPSAWLLLLSGGGLLLVLRQRRK